MENNIVVGFGMVMAILGFVFGVLLKTNKDKKKASQPKPEA